MTLHSITPVYGPEWWSQINIRLLSWTSPNASLMVVRTPIESIPLMMMEKANACSPCSPDVQPSKSAIICEEYPTPIHPFLCSL
ncbi:hypothetical protein TNCV_3756271 [Trichonephila clavipes]|nr:hypothetical protein TNCV_3756271 [Trichonephila clavipes]